MRFCLFCSSCLCRIFHHITNNTIIQSRIHLIQQEVSVMWKLLRVHTTHLLSFPLQYIKQCSRSYIQTDSFCIRYFIRKRRNGERDSEKRIYMAAFTPSVHACSRTFGSVFARIIEKTLFSYQPSMHLCLMICGLGRVSMY